MPREWEKKNCRNCGSVIWKGARVCPECQTHIGAFRFVVGAGQFLLVSVAVVAAVISYIQYDEARKERIKAEEARDLAQQAISKLQLVEYQTQSIQSFTRSARFMGDRAHALASKLQANLELINSRELEHESTLKQQIEFLRGAAMQNVVGEFVEAYYFEARMSCEAQPDTCRSESNDFVETVGYVFSYVDEFISLDGLDPDDVILFGIPAIGFACVEAQKAEPFVGLDKEQLSEFVEDLAAYCEQLLGSSDEV